MELELAEDLLEKKNKDKAPSKHEFNEIVDGKCIATKGVIKKRFYPSHEERMKEIKVEFLETVDVLNAEINLNPSEDEKTNDEEGKNASEEAKANVEEG